MSALLHLYLDQFLIFVLVLTRVGSLLMVLPVLGTATIPMHVRGLLAVAISQDSRSNWLEGAQLLAVYLIFATAFYFAG